MVLMEVLEGRSVGYGGEIHPPGSTFLCDPKFVAGIVAQSLAKPVGETTPTLLGLSLIANGIGDVPPQSEYEVQGSRESEASKAEERQALFEELENLGVTASQKTNTKTLKQLVQRARMEARQ